MKTPKQKERQLHRNQGKYAQVNPCYCCGKSAGVDYFSHPLTDTGDWNDIGLVLCKRCADKTCDITDLEEFKRYKAQFGDAAQKAWEKILP